MLTFESELDIVLISFCTHEISHVVSSVLLCFNVKINEDGVRLFFFFVFSFTFLFVCDGLKYNICVVEF